MAFEQKLGTFLGIFLMMLLSSPSVAQIQELKEFKGVKIPWTFKHKDVVIEKGEYDLLFLTQGPTLFHLRIKKRRKLICLITEGERLRYKNERNLWALLSDPEIPENPKLQIKRNPVLKIIYIIFETGKHTKICPLYKIRFKVEYEDKF